MLQAPLVEGTVEVGAGRRLGFAEFGDPLGRPVLWLHGTPGARRQIPPAARTAAVELGVRLIGVDRPGVGGSTPHLHASVAAAAADLDRLTERLGIGAFALLGLSGGGPYVLGCAAAHPERVRVAGVLGGVAPAAGKDAARGGVTAWAATFARPLAALHVPLSWALAGTFWSARPLAVPALAVYARLSPEPDRRLFARPEMRAMFLDDLLNGGRTGLRAPVYDVVLFGRPWGFALADVTAPVHWWHGDADHIVPLAHGRHCVDRLPRAELHVVPGESHLGTLSRAEDVLGTLLAEWSERDAAQLACDPCPP